MEARPVRLSRCVMTEIVIPNDLNGLGNLLGGRLLHWMDLCAAISAQRHTNRVCVTAAVDFVEFRSPIKQGEIVVLESQVNRAFRSSMEVEVNVWAEDPLTRSKRFCNRAFYTFVAVNEEGRPVPVPPVLPETPEEQERYEQAARRRELRLLLSGRLPAEKARRLQAALTELAATASEPPKTNP